MASKESRDLLIGVRDIGEAPRHQTHFGPFKRREQSADQFVAIHHFSPMRSAVQSAGLSSRYFLISGSNRAFGSAPPVLASKRNWPIGPSIFINLIAALKAAMASSSDCRAAAELGGLLPWERRRRSKE